MMKTRFDILGHLPLPNDIPLDILKPIGIPERFTLHEFLLGSASGVSETYGCPHDRLLIPTVIIKSLKNA
jgi:hypothetical protein